MSRPQSISHTNHTHSTSSDSPIPHFILAQTDPADLTEGFGSYRTATRQKSLSHAISSIFRVCGTLDPLRYCVLHGRRTHRSLSLDHWHTLLWLWVDHRACCTGPRTCDRGALIPSEKQPESFLSRRHTSIGPASLPLAIQITRLTFASHNHCEAPSICHTNLYDFVTWYSDSSRLIFDWHSSLCM
jgi:hypothetical protein